VKSIYIAHALQTRSIHVGTPPESHKCYIPLLLQRLILMLQIYLRDTSCKSYDGCTMTVIFSCLWNCSGCKDDDFSRPWWRLAQMPVSADFSQPGGFAHRPMYRFPAHVPAEVANASITHTQLEPTTCNLRLT